MIADLKSFFALNKEDRVNKGTWINELARKIVHVTTSFLIILMYPFVDLYLGSLVLVFSIFLNVGISNSSVFNFLNKVNRITYGNYSFIFGTFITFFVSKYINSDYSYLVFVYTMLVLGLSDSFAASGKFFLKSRFANLWLLKPLALKIGNKTLFGFTVFTLIAIVSGVLVILPYTNFNTVSLIKIIVISLLLGLTELFSSLGLDNLLIPLFSYALFYLFW